MNHFSYPLIIVQINIFKSPKIYFPSHPCPNFGEGTARKFRGNDQKQQNLLLFKLGSNQLWPLFPGTKSFIASIFLHVNVKSSYLLKLEKVSFQEKFSPNFVVLLLSFQNWAHFSNFDNCPVFSPY